MNDETNYGWLFSAEQLLSGIDLHSPKAPVKAVKVCTDIYRKVMEEERREIRQAIFFFCEGNKGVCLQISDARYLLDDLKEYARNEKAIAYCFVSCARAAVIPNTDERFEKFRSGEFGIADVEAVDCVSATAVFPAAFYGELCRYEVDRKNKTITFLDEDPTVLDAAKEGELKTYFLHGLLPWEEGAKQ